MDTGAWLDPTTCPRSHGQLVTRKKRALGGLLGSEPSNTSASQGAGLYCSAQASSVDVRVEDFFFFGRCAVTTVSTARRGKDLN